MVLGWVRDTALAEACHVQVNVAGETVAEAVADLFRQDVLHGGHGHGHHGFAARLRRRLPPGPCMAVMNLPRRGVGAPMPLVVPVLDAPAPERVEDMLRQLAGWTTADVASHVSCLRLEANYARRGGARFVDAVFRFAFGRWPTKAETRMNMDSLSAGRITPSGLMLECLASRERADLPPDLPSPFDPQFPFDLSGIQPSPPTQGSPP